MLICTLPDEADCPVLWQCVPWCEYLQETGGADQRSEGGKKEDFYAAD